MNTKIILPLLLLLNPDYYRFRTVIVGIPGLFVFNTFIQILQERQAMMSRKSNDDSQFFMLVITSLKE